MVMTCRRISLTARCGGFVGALAVFVASPAAADDADALTELVDAAAQRLQIAEPVAAVKWQTHGPIEDPDRIQQELAKLATQASARQVDPDYVTKVFGDQINATEGIEYRRFADWKLDPAGAPTQSADLAASRSAIDDLNQTMLNQIVADWDLLHSAACPAQLDLARDGVVRTRRLDAIYQRALALATRSYCQQ
ncbi:chorismate mutase [Mycobacterium sp. E3298]|uniref:chorismate mutase n=2 Tax=Mycobacterium TaxID=1763 RepID=UPI0007FE548C|nr:chorismate mutase [Mycobacterium sp. E188]OBG97052.1 chorismate mutase [Mycobacterium sp. E3298]OBH34897.1 chorismate mutase [Mycobacterium sp. E183]